MTMIRLVRGGDWCDIPKKLRAAYRLRYFRQGQFDTLGFRVVVREDGADRVARGGSWCAYTRGVRSAYQSGYEPGCRNFILGFRVAVRP